MSTPTVLQMVPTLDGGGIARATVDAAQAVIAEGGTALVASAGGSLVPELLRLRASHLELPPHRNALWAGVTLPRKLASRLRDVSISVVQSRSPATGWLAHRLARRLGLRWIATLHAPFVARSVTGRLVERRQLSADCLIAVSDHVARDAVARFPQLEGRIETILPGVNFDRFDPALVRADRVIRLATTLRLPDGNPIILCANRLDEDNGQAVLIEAVKQMGHPDVFCLLLGAQGTPTPFEKELERRIEAAELQGRVKIGPYVEDMPAAYMLADVVVATGGAREGFSRTLIEAQAMGRPVVAEGGGGAAEAVVPGVTGWLAGAGDAGSLAEALRSALTLSTQRRAELARHAQRHARDRYPLARSNGQLVQLYKRMAMERSPTAARLA